MTSEIKTNKADDLEQIAAVIDNFHQERGWSSSAGDTAKSIIIEAAELLEHYQWDETRIIHGRSLHTKDTTKIGEEAADILWYLIDLCTKEGISLKEAFYDKLIKNETKYPASEFKGKHNEEFYKSQKKKYREERQK